MDADLAVQRREIERQHTRRRHLSWVAGALAVSLAALITAAALARPAAMWTPSNGHTPYRVWVKQAPATTCAPIQTMYVDETVGAGCEQP